MCWKGIVKIRYHRHLQNPNASFSKSKVLKGVVSRSENDMPEHLHLKRKPAQTFTQLKFIFENRVYMLVNGLTQGLSKLNLTF